MIVVNNSNMQGFFGQFRTVRFAQGEQIFMQDEEPSRAYAVKEGIVKVYNLTSEGEEKPIAFKMRGDIFSLGWLFGRHQRMLYFYEAHTDCELHVLERPSFQRQLKEDPRVSAAIMNYLISEHLSDGFRFNALAQSHARQKIVHLLHTLCLRYGIEIKENVVQITVPLRQQDIANFLGITRETAALELKRLRTERVLTVKNRLYTIHTNALNQLLDDEYDPGLTL